MQEKADEDANIIFGTIIDDNLGDEVRVTIIATGFDEAANVRPDAAQATEQAQVEQAPRASLFDDRASQAAAPAPERELAHREQAAPREERAPRHSYDSQRGGLFTSTERSNFGRQEERRDERDGGDDDFDIDVPDFLR